MKAFMLPIPSFIIVYVSKMWSSQKKIPTGLINYIFEKFGRNGE